ncbi:CRISPR-associated endonuclease Cas2 [Sodaliphilus sp.]|uniref:CRISPR-associated endonuclease Cas2 n=1 Tax=Sodaliphilus sp. TaxID=2815818 RepID=UPI00389045CF
MARRDYEQLPWTERMKRLMHASLKEDAHIVPGNIDNGDDNQVGTLSERVNRIFGFINNKRNTDMTFFVMYDIESNKVRRHIAKYLLESGCIRLQRSMFLANLPHEKFNKIKDDLAQVQACYDNDDSILVVPISCDLLQAMKVIGRDINVDIVLRTSSTLFF